MGYKLTLLLLLAAAAPAMAATVPTGREDDKDCAPGAVGGLRIFSGDACRKGSTTEPMSCAPEKYKDHPGGVEACNKCKATVTKWQKKLASLGKKYQDSDSSLSGLTSGLTSALSGADLAGSTDALKKTKEANEKGKQGQRDRADNAKKASDEFEQCLREIDSDCPSSLAGGTDVTSATNVRNACQDGKRNSDKFANEKKKESNGLGDIGKLAEAASKAMGAIPKPQDQGQQPSASEPAASAATSPTPTATNSQTQVSKFDDKSGASSPVVGLSTESAKVSAPSTHGGSVTGASSGYDADHRGASESGGQGGAPATAVSGGGSGGGGGGGLAGAARDGSAAATPAAEILGNNYELSPGGGLRSAGLKSGGKGGDEAPLGDISALPPSESGLAPLDEDANRDPASADAAEEMDGDSIFIRVRQKYSLLKGAGRI